MARETYSGRSQGSLCRGLPPSCLLRACRLLPPGLRSPLLLRHGGLRSPFPLGRPLAGLLSSMGPQPRGSHLPWAAASSSSSSSYSRSPSPRLGSEDGERAAAFSLQRLGHGLARPPRAGRVVGCGGHGGGQWVKQRRDEVGSDRETELKPAGLPAVRKREEG